MGVNENLKVCAGQFSADASQEFTIARHCGMYLRLMQLALNHTYAESKAKYSRPSLSRSRQRVRPDAGEIAGRGQVAVREGKFVGKHALGKFLQTQAESFLRLA